MDMVKKVYKVVVCKGCGHLQITFAESNSRCFRCNRDIEIDGSTVLFKTLDPSEARKKLLTFKSAKQIQFKKLR